MTLDSLLALAAALFSGALAVAALFKRRSLARWCFFAGMGTLAAESAFGGIALSRRSRRKLRIGNLSFS